MIDYTVKPLSPEAHLFEVTLTLQSPDPNGQLLSLPAWIPGSYMIRDFAKHIVTLSAYAGETRLQAVKLDKQTWKLAPCEGPVTVSYQVYAWDLSVRGAHLDRTHGYFNGSCLFLRVHGQEDEGCLVDIQRPDGEAYADWRIATSMAPCHTEQLCFGRYGAENFQDLIDHPVEMGHFSFAAFAVAGVPHEIVITGKHYADMDRICSDLQRICQQHVALFGGLPEIKRYLFLVTAVGEGYGGLEHGSSTSLLCKRDDLPQRDMTEMSDGYRNFLGLCSHEYFHLWNVKRIRPEVFKRADLSQEVYTELLWAFEGITSYYDELALVRSGALSSEQYLEQLAETVTRVYRGRGRLKQSVAESSFDAWTKFYKQDENASNAIVSYYTKGALIALALDQLIRRESNGKQSLDDVMRQLWQRFGRCDVGVKEGDFEQLAEAVTGLDLKPFFDQAVRGRDDLDLEQFLEPVGIGFRLRAALDPKDLGGLQKPPPKTISPTATLGVVTRTDGRDVVISTVFDGGAAQIAGLAAGDVLVAVDGLRVTEANLDTLVSRAAGSSPVPVVAFRRDELMSFDVTPLPAPENTCELWLKDGLDETMLKRRSAWLTGDR